jgi:hypothetical protein
MARFILVVLIAAVTSGPALADSSSPKLNKSSSIVHATNRMQAQPPPRRHCGIRHHHRVCAR